MSTTRLSPVQEQILAAFANGASLTDAAAASGIHRNTIGNWRRTSPHFRGEFAQAQYDRALLIREQADGLAGTALDTIREILTDANVAASVRLKAALAILHQASAPPPEPPVAAIPETVTVPTTEPKIMHNNAQTAPTAFRREQPKIGRNVPCPCGSGRKFKQCCLNSAAPLQSFDQDAGAAA